MICDSRRKKKTVVVSKPGIFCFVAELKFLYRVVPKSLKTVFARHFFDAPLKRDMVEKNSSISLLCSYDKVLMWQACGGVERSTRRGGHV